MQFNTLVFAVFFVAVFVVYWLLPWLRARKLVLLVASYFFYGAFKPSYVLILVALTLFNYAMAFWLAASKDRARRLVLAAICVVDLGTLAFFKYAAFLIESANSAFGATAIQAPVLLLPIGISFYTFEVISYVVDIYRRKIDPERSLLDFSLLLAFFPRLVAGPIVRPADFLPQLKGSTTCQFGLGLHLVIVGLFQKMVIADFIMASVIDRYFLFWTGTSFLDAWTSIIAFAVQIYCDFNGYTLCAIGLALLLGFRLPANFDNPYAAIGLSDFWRRWHISLSSWIRDYLYIPLGGSRYGAIRTCANLLISMTLAGLWHGASWNFALWGLIHGVVLSIEHLLRAVARRVTLLADLAEQAVVRAVLWFITFVIVCFAWVPFRAISWESAMAMLTQMTQWRDYWPRQMTGSDTVLVLVVATAVVGHQIWARYSDGKVLQAWPVRAVSYGLMIACLLSMGGDTRRFIYFQF
jgi:alginate O-acetyltransferase complex protein AlgI